MDTKKFNINLDDSVLTKERPKQVKSLFKPSSLSGDSGRAAGETSAETATVPGKQPPSYAEFVIRRKGGGPPKGDRGGVPETGPRGTGSGTRFQKGADMHAAGTAAAPLTDVREEGQRSEAGLGSIPKAPGSGNSIIVSPRQRGNPILKFVRNVPWEFGEAVPDYVLGQTTCALFLSLRYHNLNPNYIHDRLKQLGQSYTLRVLLVQVDVKDPHHALKELARICIMADCTLILAWSPEEAGRYLETYKAYEKKPADLLKEQVEKDFLSKFTDCLTTVKSVNKTDALTMLSTFTSLEGVINASKEDLALCPGLGPQKARRIYDVLHQPFLKARKSDM
ncbi:DNA excision repair protein ERCC-1 [Scleropages formosus]|uniref:DNA excision repair protein ERCC-1 n=1 Tax=Scleropages formosus TaxID=113540 RepID=A0A8C9RLX5_SCLFO|nr:DNA excision repair protein ERCC-1 [Scleropages formosus]